MQITVGESLLKKGSLQEFSQESILLGGKFDAQ